MKTDKTKVTLRITGTINEFLEKITHYKNGFRGKFDTDLKSIYMRYEDRDGLAKRIFEYNFHEEMKISVFGLGMCINPIGDTFNIKFFQGNCSGISVYIEMDIYSKDKEGINFIKTLDTSPEREISCFGMSEYFFRNQ